VDGFVPEVGNITGREPPGGAAVNGATVAPVPQGERLETDYLVVGAGALAMAFVDTLLEDPDVDIVMVDRRPGPGGHWLDAYPFVRLHQPSVIYGVSSTPLGQDRIEPDGADAGFYERASGAEICGYFDEVMRHRFLASGRVRFLPMSDYLAEGRFRSLVTGRSTEVVVRRRVVDGTYMASRVPATDPPPFEVAEGVGCVPVGGLACVETPPAGYVIVGGGKTALDACCWLLDRGTDPDDITWIRPRDAWVLNRAFFQPHRSALRTFEGTVIQLEAMSECNSVEEVYQRLEESGVMYRTDPTVQPTMMKGGTISRAELDQLCSIRNVVRLGHVQRIELDWIVLDGGSIPTSTDHLHVHCASPGLSDRPARPIFTADTITLQLVTRSSLMLSGALTGFLETTGRKTEEKNRLCRAMAWPHTPFDWLRTLLDGIGTEMGWQDAPDLRDWLERSRLNILRGLAESGDPTQVKELQSRFFAALFPALEKLEAFAAEATAAERARRAPAPEVA
jgi:hypothetical protein